MAKSNFNKVKVNEQRHVVITPIFRVSFPYLFQPRESESGDKIFSVDMIFDSKEEFKLAYEGKKKQTVSMMQAVVNVKKDQWGPDKEKWPKFKYPIFKDGNSRVKKDTGEVYEGYKDKWFITAKSGEKFPPKILGPDLKPLTNEKDLYGGCFARAQIVAMPYYYAGNYGVRFVLNQVMKVRDGDKFGGITEDAFDAADLGDIDETSDEDSEDMGF